MLLLARCLRADRDVGALGSLVVAAVAAAAVETAVAAEVAAAAAVAVAADC